MGTYKLLIYITFLIIISVNCQKDDIEQLPPPDKNGYIWLRNVKSLPLIKKTIQGTWKMHYAYGGFTGHNKNNLKDSWFRYLPNDSIYIIFDGDLYAATKPNFVRKQVEFGFDAWVMDFKFINDFELREEFIIDIIKGDTLILDRNAPDSYGYFMTRFP